MTALWIAISLALGSSSAQTTKIHDHRCVNAEPTEVKTLFTRYSDYSTLPGAAHSVSLMGSSLDLIKMIKSQSKEVSQTDSTSEHWVWLVLKPALLEDAALYPRFLLNCRVSGNSNGFKQTCSLMKDKQRFGLNHLEIAITVSDADSLCKTGKTGIDVSIQIEGNSTEIARIKKAVLEPAGILAPLISVFFDEDQFFRSYFANIYGKWMDLL